MNRKKAKLIAETITNKQLKEMFDNAKVNVKDWTQISICNKSMTKGTAWNILAKDFDINYKHHIITKTNMVREFGEFLSKEFIKKEKKKKIFKPIHQDPIF